MTKHKKQHNQDTEMGGELDVTGQGSVSIKIRKDPKEVEVFFEDEVISVPCNPPNSDFVSWNVISHHHETLLVISWEVISMREIAWIVKY